MISNLTIYCPYYNSGTQLKYILDKYSNMELSTRQKLHIFIVDDGSLEVRALDIINSLDKLCSKLNIILYRIDIDIPWNMPEANNLAFEKILTDYVIRCDIDHFFEEIDLKKIFELDVKDHIMYNFDRKGIYYQSNDQPSLQAPKNIYLINKQSYWKTGGYNEYFSGHYGDDKDFIPRSRTILDYKILSDVSIYVLINGHTRKLKRDLSETLEKLKNKDRPFLTFLHRDKYIKQYENLI